MKNLIINNDNNTDKLTDEYFYGILKEYQNIIVMIVNKEIFKDHQKEVIESVKILEKERNIKFTVIIISSKDIEKK